MNLFCLPVCRRDNRFVAIRSTTPRDLPRFHVLAPYFRKHYTELQDCRVDISGVVYRATVYEPRDVSDTAYAIVTELRIPPEQDTAVDKIKTLLRVYWQRAHDWLRHTDSLSPMRCTFLEDEFILPRFIAVDPSKYEPETVSWGDLQQYARVVLLGPPGCGKTTCLRMLAISAAKPSSTDRTPRLPVFIPMRELTEDYSIISYAARELGMKPDADEFMSLAHSGKLMLLCDGLDEIEDRIGVSAKSQLQDICRRFPDVGVAITTRESGYTWRFNGFVFLRIQPFSPLQRDEWIRRRIGSANDSAAKVLVSSLESAPMKDQASNPLLLSILAAAFEASGTTHTCTSDILLRLVDALIDKWDAARSVKRWDIRPYDETQTLRVLCRTAFNSTKGNDNQFTIHAFNEWEDEWADKVDAAAFLKYIWKVSSLLEPEANQTTWRFKSNTIRDVLCAKYLVERTDDMFQASPTSSGNDNFDRIWQYCCEISQDATPVVSALLKCPIRPEARAAIVMTVLVGNASIKKRVLRDAHDALKKDLADIANDLRVDADSVPQGRGSVVIRLRTKKSRVCLDRVAEIFSCAVGGGKDLGRSDLVRSLADENHWLIQYIRQWLADGSRLGPFTVEVSDDAVIVKGPRN